MSVLSIFVAVALIATGAEAIDRSKVVWSVNAGGEEFIDSHGIHYKSDKLMVGTPSDYGTRLKIHRAPAGDVPLYQTERYHSSTFGYDIRLPSDSNGDYVLVMKFCEVWFNAPNAKVFDVVVNGEHVVVERLDIFATVGRGVAHDVAVPFSIAGDRLTVGGEQSVFDGVLTIEFVKGAFDNPKVNAMYVLKGAVSDVPALPPLQPSYDTEELLFDDDDEDSAVGDSWSDDGEELNLGAVKQSKEKFTNDKKSKSKPKTMATRNVNADPYEDVNGLQTLLPILTAIVAFVPLVVCLCRL